MSSKKKKSVFFLCALVLFSLCLPVFAENGKKDEVKKERPAARGWDTVSGILVKVAQSDLSLPASEALALKKDDGSLVVLIGEKMNELKRRAGDKITVTGVYKPELPLSQGFFPVLEVRFIDFAPEK